MSYFLLPTRPSTSTIHLGPPIAYQLCPSILPSAPSRLDFWTLTSYFLPPYLLPPTSYLVPEHYFPPDRLIVSRHASAMKRAFGADYPARVSQNGRAIELVTTNLCP